MDRKHFDDEPPAWGRTLCYVGAALLVTLILSQALFLTGDESHHGLLLGVAGWSLLLVALTLGAFLLRYRSHPLVHEKRTLLAQAHAIDASLNQAAQQIEDAKQKRRAIDADKQATLERRQAAYQSQLVDIERRRRGADAQEQKELASELLRLQESHVARGLRTTSVAAANIPGIGPKLKERLAFHGIGSAADVAAPRVSAIPGFGEAKTNAMLNWRAQCQAYFERTRPADLPRSQQAAIHQKHQRQRAQLDDEVQSAATDLRTEMEAIRSEAAARHAANDAIEARATDRIETIQPRKRELEADLQAYSDINPLAFFTGCLRPVAEQRRLPGSLLPVVLPLILAASLFCQGSAALSALIAMAGEARDPVTSARGADIGFTATLPPAPEASSTLTPEPTSPPTVTSSPVPSPTPTLTVTPNLTPSRTPTVTPSPTHTLTPTPNPTDTPAPSPTPQPTNTPAPTPPPARTEAIVTHVVDGDTIDVTIGGQPFTVRYIGIDAPESGQPCSAEATAANAELVAGKTVYLEKDVSETDQYGRLLRYVYLADGTFVNARLVRLGFAMAKEYPPDTKHRALFADRQQKAQAEQLCLWKPAPTPTPVVQPTVAPVPRANCSPCYPDVCIPPPPPDLDCPEISYCRFRVVGCDPHRFDGDHDGIGCERCY